MMGRLWMDRRPMRCIAAKLGAYGLAMACALVMGALSQASAFPDRGARDGAYDRGGYRTERVARAGYCGEDDVSCVEYEVERYPGPRVHPRNWEPEPEPEPIPYVVEEHEEKAVDCVEERYAARTEVVVERRPAIRETRRVVESYDEFCGVRCWYKRLRAGYCGRGCDYYRFRMTEFPEGRVRHRRVQVACR